MDAAERLIRQVPFFESLDRVEISRLLGALEPRAFPSGSVVFKEECAGEEDGGESARHRASLHVRSRM